MTFTIPSSTFSNPSNQAITYNFTGLPSGLVSQGSLLSGTPTVTGTSTVTIVASTPDGQNATTSFSINVITPQPLTILSPSYGCFTGDLIFRSLGGTAGAIEYLAAGISNWTSQAGGHNYRPNLGDGPVTIFARNTDAPSNVVTYSWDWKNQCRDFNQSPSINVSMASPQSATLNQPYSYTLPTNLFSDPEGQPLVYSVTGLPSGITYNGGTRISGVPSLTGVFTISVKATDAYDLATTAQYSLSIVPSNTVSLPLSLTAPDYNCTTGAFIFNTVGGNGSTIEYFAIGITGWTTQRNFTVTPTIDAQSFTLYARQSGTQVTMAWNWTSVCASQNHAPTSNTAVNLPSQTAVTASTFSYTLPANIFNDYENQALSYSALGLPNGLALNGQVVSGVTNTTGIFTVTIIATDPYSATASRTFTLTVTGSPVNQTVLQLLQPNYNCSTGDFIFQSTVGNGTTIEYMAVGITGWTANPGPFEVLPAPDAQPFTLMARQNGVYVTYTWDWYAQCH